MSYTGNVFSRRPADPKSRRGFTLTELLVAMTVIGVLSAIVVPRYADMKIRSIIASSKQTISTLANALQVFQLDYGRFPTSIYYDSRQDLASIRRSISHMSNVDIPDPFQKPYGDVQIEADPDSGLGYQEDHRRHGFIYVNYRDFLGREFSAYNGIALYSIGPDRRDSWLSLYPLPFDTKNLIRRRLYTVYGDGALQPVVVYNPTNGIRSGGDYGAFRGEFDGFIPSDI
ncbi:MAG: prepilin-type N-terminal cleavage/methylation domain-containing protein [Candidatus Omnitrophica bacterium]|nr:prepilin-type N-terminal cleavage/methylation domain-containing protein [Candidatus Omnitrophota bacterium]